MRNGEQNMLQTNNQEKNQFFNTMVTEKGTDMADRNQ